jgi:hypothetical protein
MSEHSTIITILLAFLVVAVGGLGVLNQSRIGDLWDKFNRVTMLFSQREESIRTEIREQQKQITDLHGHIMKIEGKLDKRKNET